MDLASGAEHWQVGLQGVDKVQASVLHQLAPHRLLLQVPGRYFALGTTRGLLSSRSGPPTWTLVWRGGGACALRATCQLQPIACDDGRPLGPARQERDGKEMFGERESAGPICISKPGMLGAPKGAGIRGGARSATPALRSFAAPVHIRYGVGAANRNRGPFERL